MTKFVEIYIPMKIFAQNLTVKKIYLFSQYDDHERNYKPVSDMCFSLILS